MRRLVLAASIIVLSMSSPGKAQSPPAAGMVVATVNGETISLAELDGALSANLPVLPLTAAQRRQLRSALLSDLIDDRLIKQYLAKKGPKVDAAELDAQLKEFTAQLQRENQTLAQYLKKTGLTEAKLRADWTESIQLSSMVQHQVTDNEIRAYHAANRDFFDKVEIRISHLFIRSSKGALPGERAAAMEKIQAIRAELIAGKTDFATAARKHSQDDNSRIGGDLGFMLRRSPQLEEALLKAAFALKVGEVSDVLETPTGLHLLKVTERKPGKPTTVENCIADVLEAYTDDFRANLIAMLRKEAQIRISLP